MPIDRPSPREEKCSCKSPNPFSGYSERVRNNNGQNKRQNRGEDQADHYCDDDADRRERSSPSRSRKYYCFCTQYNVFT